MDPANPPATAAAQRALAVLESYARDVRRQATAAPEDESHRITGLQMDEIRGCCAPYPDLSLPLTMLLISHAELVQHLWASSSRGTVVDGEATRSLLAAHLRRVDHLAHACYAVLGLAAPRH